MAVIAENQDSIVFKADKVIIVASYSTSDFELIRVLFEYLHMLSAHNYQCMIISAFGNDQQGTLAKKLEELGLGRETTTLDTRLQDNHSVEIVIFISLCPTSSHQVETTTTKSFLVLSRSHLLISWPVRR